VSLRIKLAGWSEITLHICALHSSIGGTPPRGQSDLLKFVMDSDAPKEFDLVHGDNDA